MRRLVRLPCPASVQAVLDRRQSKVDAGSPVKAEWNSFRGLKAYKELRSTLEEALGWRRRCAYCSDSLGADVEHFWPKEKYPGRAFRYENLWLICTPCNRKKLDRFPLLGGVPQLIDPFFDDPWDSLYFAAATGWIAARVTTVTSDGTPMHAPKGQTTLEVLGDLINAEPVRSARLRSWASILSRFEELLTGARSASTLAEAFGDIDDYGLAEWLLFREGKEVGAVVELRNANPEGWVALRELPRD